jgi:hypothetical protein
MRTKAEQDPGSAQAITVHVCPSRRCTSLWLPCRVVQVIPKEGPLRPEEVNLDRPANNPVLYTNVLTEFTLLLSVQRCKPSEACFKEHSKGPQLAELKTSRNDAGRPQPPCCASEQRTFASFVVRRIATRHRITSSACSMIDSGIVMPSARAVLRLTTSSNLVGCSIGKSPGLAPLRILST